MSDNKKIEKKIVPSLISEKDYKTKANRSGDPLLISNSESRLYSNDRVNGTTLVLLAALSASGKKEKKIDIENFKIGVKVLKSDNYGNAVYKNLEKNYNRGSNRSSDPAKKISPVLSALISRGNNGFLKGFAVDKIGDEATRKVFGFSF